MRTRRCATPETFAVVTLFLTIVASTVAYAQAERPSPLTRHVREAVVNGQAPLVGRLPENQSMRLVLVLPLINRTELDNVLKDLYDPYSASYREFLTVEQFTERFGPGRDDYDALIHFAEACGFTVVGTSRNRVNLDVTGSVASIEKAFHLTMGVYQHPTENRIFFAPDREPTPDLAVPLWRIAGLDNYSIPKPALVFRDPGVRSNATTGSGPGTSFLGSDMRAAYYGGTALTGSGQSVGLLEYRGTDLADLYTYYANVGQTLNVPITLKSVDTQSTSCTDNMADDYCDDGEQTLDMTQALGMAPNLSSLVMYIGTGGKLNQTIDDAGIFNAMATANPLNAQLSGSWTWAPADPNTDNPYFKEFAAQGQNLFQASGDSGEWTTALLQEEKLYPADDVYLTSVGGTDLDTKSAGGPWGSETAWSDSGGGISPDDFPIPSWQTATAAGCSGCSQTYRNGPDVSANANTTFYVCYDQLAPCSTTGGGTSFAAPMWAGYLALANEQVGIPTLGFINPALYAIGLGSTYHTDFHDITSGCQESNGFCAAAGYDLVTGWGSPNGANLINALAGPGFTVSATPSSQTTYPSGATSFSVTVSPLDRFTSTVALSVTGLPAGATGTFNPASISGGSGSSTLSITTSSTTPLGTYPLTIKGTSGKLVHTTPTTLVVAPLCSATPSCGGSGNVVIATITLSCQKATQISTEATACGTTCNSNYGQSGVYTSSSAGATAPSNGSGSCTLNWCYGGNCYQSILQP